MSQSERAVAKLNNLLASELGSNPFGEGLYRWIWCHNLTHPMQQTDSAGQPKLVYRCSCGLDRLVHFPSCNGIVLPEPVYVLREVVPFLKRQWLIALWSPAATVEFTNTQIHLVELSPQAWREKFGSALEYPARGYLVPVGGPHGGVVALGPGEEPSDAATWEFIYARRKEQKKTLADLERETNDALAKHDRNTDAYLDDAIADACTAFGNIPGTKGGVSFPSIVRP